LRSRREEYAKRFEELTKQEIKNYNDSLLNTHVAMEEFRLKLKDSVDQYASQVAKLSSTIKTVQIENANLKDEISNLSRRLERETHDFNKLEREKIESDKHIEEFKDWSRDKIDQHYNSIYTLQLRVSAESSTCKYHDENLSRELAHSYQQSQVDNNKLKEEILAIPSEAKKVKKDLLIKVSESAIDNVGILKELQMIKKKSTIQESMNEYFHTQLNRLKDK
jgi:uncharacterized phage infection (PIP) family protein YhgE